MIQWLIDNKDLATLLFTAVVAVSTVVYAVLTAFLVRETAQMRRAQTEPSLSVYFLPKEEFANLGHLHIKNIGLGAAFDLRISITPEGSAAGCDLLLNDFLKVKTFAKGLNYLAPGQILRSGFTSMAENYQEKIKAVLQVSLSYKSADGTKRSETFRVDFSELEGYGSLGKPHLYSIAQSLEKIQRDLGHLSTGFHKPKVDIFDHEDRERERLEWEEERQDMIRKQEQKDGEQDA